MLVPAYLYRGTTINWPGNDMLQAQRITCTTTDPLIATLFAIECRNHGRAVILAARREFFEPLVGPSNYFSVSESAVNLQVAPIEFARNAEVALDVDRSLEILRRLGFHDIPVRLSDHAALQQEIDESHASGLRLNGEQIALFNIRMIESSS